MRKTIFAATVMAGALCLGGCQSIFGSPQASRSSAGIADASSYFASLIQTGRMHLRQGRPTRATEAFRQASYHPEFAAEAYNGMAVSYMRLGRADLAERYFNQAIAADPLDPRFGRNLARLQQQTDLPGNADSVQMASTEAVRSSTGSRLPPGLTLEQAYVPVQIEGQAVALVRLDSREVHVSARNGDQAANGSRRFMAARRPVHIETNNPDSQTTLIRVASNEVRLSSVSNRQAEYPIRIALNDIQSANSPVRRAEYPIRIPLN